jgi:hypothetical protein
MILRSASALFPSFQGVAVTFSMMARFLRLFSRHGGNLSPSTSGGQYIPGEVKREDSSAETGIRGVPEKAYSYLWPCA